MKSRCNAIRIPVPGRCDLGPATIPGVNAQRCLIAFSGGPRDGQTEEISGPCPESIAILGTPGPPVVYRMSAERDGDAQIYRLFAVGIKRSRQAK